LQMAVIYVPFLQRIFKTQALSMVEITACLAVSTVVFWAVEGEKRYRRKRMFQSRQP